MVEKSKLVLNLIYMYIAVLSFIDKNVFAWMSSMYSEYNFLAFAKFFGLSFTEDIICQNVDLVHENLYRMNFSFNPWVETSASGL
jgi:hypothetical protein